MNSEGTAANASQTALPVPNPTEAKTQESNAQTPVPTQTQKNTPKQTEKENKDNSMDEDEQPLEQMEMDEGSADQSTQTPSYPTTDDSMATDDAGTEKNEEEQLSDLAREIMAGFDSPAVSDEARNGMEKLLTMNIENRELMKKAFGEIAQLKAEKSALEEHKKMVDMKLESYEQREKLRDQDEFMAHIDGMTELIQNNALMAKAAEIKGFGMKDVDALKSALGDTPEAAKAFCSFVDIVTHHSRVEGEKNRILEEEFNRRVTITPEQNERRNRLIAKINRLESGGYDQATTHVSMNSKDAYRNTDGNCTTSTAPAPEQPTYDLSTQDGLQRYYEAETARIRLQTQEKFATSQVSSWVKHNSRKRPAEDDHYNNAQAESIATRYTRRRTTLDKGPSLGEEYLHQRNVPSLEDIMGAYDRSNQ